MDMKEKKTGNAVTLPTVLCGQRLRIGGITYYMQSGKLRACASKRGKRPSATAKEVRARGAFAAVRKLWSMYRRALGGLEIWRVAAREAGGGKADSLFHSMNAATIDAEGQVWAFAAFRFSAGSLAMPVLRAVERAGRTVRVEWEEHAGCVAANGADRLYVGYFYGTAPGSPCLLEVAGVARADGAAEFAVPASGEPEDAALHLYFFFASPDGSRFSPSVYAGELN